MVKLDAHYVDPRLVALYDLENAGRHDTDFYLALAAELDAHHILDLGCGTGVLTRELALVPGRQVVGVEPAAAMLDVARQHPDAARVRWVEGDASALGTPDADLVTMTGNVAQVFLEDDEWMAALHAIHAALRSGGHLAFESRNPAARAWESWNRTASYSEFDSPFGPIATWVEVTSVEDERVRMLGHNRFQATGEEIVGASELRFRSHDTLTRDLTDAGFTIERVYGDWQRGPFLPARSVMIFIARRN